MRNKTFPLRSFFFSSLFLSTLVLSFFISHKNILIRNNHKKTSLEEKTQTAFLEANERTKIKVIKISPTLTASHSPLIPPILSYFFFAPFDSATEISNSLRVALIFTRWR